MNIKSLFPHFQTREVNYPLIGFAEDDQHQHKVFVREVKHHWPKVEVLPAVLVRLRDTLSGKPSMLFRKSRERFPAAAPEWRPCVWTAAPEAPVEDRAAITFSKPAEPLLFVTDEVGELPDDFFEKLKALPPSERAHLLLQHLAPLCVSRQLQPQDPQREELDNATHEYSI